MNITAITSATVSMNLVATCVFVTMATVEMEQTAVSPAYENKQWCRKIVFIGECTNFTRELMKWTTPFIHACTRTQNHVALCDYLSLALCFSASVICLSAGQCWLLVLRPLLKIQGGGGGVPATYKCHDFPRFDLPNMLGIVHMMLMLHLS